MNLYAPRLNPEVGRIKGKRSISHSQDTRQRPSVGDQGDPLPTQPSQCCRGDLVLSELGATAVISSGCSTEH